MSCLSDEVLGLIRDSLKGTTSRKFKIKDFDIVGTDDKSILTVSKVGDEYKPEFNNIGDISFFINARRYIPRLLGEIERLKNINRKQGHEISVQDMQIKRYIEVEKNRREEFKQLHALLKDYDIPESGPTRFGHQQYSPLMRFQILIEQVTDCVIIQEDKQAEAQQKVLTIFNRLLRIIPVTYDELNKKFLADGKEKDRLLELEKEFEELGLSEHPDSEKQGVSILSLLATITDAFCGKRLTFNLGDDNRLMSVCYYFYNEKGDWVEDIPVNHIPEFTKEEEK
jgi:hypothetical protein